MRVTAAEMGGCKDEGAARRVPLGSEIDMVLGSQNANVVVGRGRMSCCSQAVE